MAVTDVNEIWDGRSGADDGSTRTRERIWRIITDDPFDDAPIVEAAVGVVAGDPHPNDFGAKARSINARQGESRLVWLVTVSYSSAKDLQPNPLNDPAEISWDGEPFQRPLIKDKDGKAVLNSAGDPFDPPIMRDDNRPVASVTKNVGSVPTWVLNYRDVVNSDQFTLDGLTIAAGKAKIKWISVSPRQERNGVSFRTLAFQIHLNKDGWAFEVLDRGFRELDPNDATKRIQIRDDEKRLVTEPVLLDGSGARLADPDENNAVFRDFDGYEELPFSVLPLT